MNNISKTTFGAIIVLMIFFTSCKTKAQQLECLNLIINNNQQLKNYSKVQAAIEDTINYWKDNKITLAQHYKNDKWKVDAILFNKSKNKCFIIIVGIDTVFNASSNFVNYGVGQLSKDSIWNFYFAGITELFIPKNIQENNFDQLSKIARKELIKGGIIKECSINDNYISGWFNENLYRAHTRFLNNKVQ